MRGLGMRRRLSGEVGMRGRSSVFVLVAVLAGCSDADLEETTLAERLVPVQGYAVWENPPIENGDPTASPAQP